MTDEQAKNMILRAIHNAGVEVVTDKQVMESVLGECLRDKTAAACIEKQVITYAEGERQPDLHMVPLSIKDAKGKDQLMYGVAFYGDRPKGYVPKQTGKAYKLMEQWPDGTLHALFAAANRREYKLGEWNWAEGFSRDESQGELARHLAPRYGWHMGTGVPSAPHLMGIGTAENPVPGYYSKTDSGHPKGSRRVWVECSFDATTDYTDTAENNPAPDKDIRGLCPFGGYYMFQESNLSNWVVASSIRLERIIPEAERQEIMKNAGYNEELTWRKRCLRPKLKAAVTQKLNLLKKGADSTQTIDAILKITHIAMLNESIIDSLSQGREPVYNEQFYLDMTQAYKVWQQQAPQADAIDALLKKRAGFYKQAGKSKAFREAGRMLTQEEIVRNRDEIRETLTLNPDWLADDEAKVMTTLSGKVLGFTKNGTIYLDKDNMELETPIHEYVHLWDKLCQKTNPKLWEQGVALMKQTKLWQAVKESPEYQGIAHDDNLIASEVHARLTSRSAADQLRKAKEPKRLIERLKVWNRAFWQSIRKTCQKFTGKTDTGKVSLEDFMQAPFADLVSERPFPRAGAKAK